MLKVSELKMVGSEFYKERGGLRAVKEIKKKLMLLYRRR